MLSDCVGSQGKARVGRVSGGLLVSLRRTTCVAECKSVTELVLGKDSANKLSQISLSNDTVQKRIDELCQDNKDQTLHQERASPIFAIQCDETTDIALCSQLLIAALVSRTLPAEMMDVLNVAVMVVNFIKARALNIRLFKLLCKDMEFEHKALLFHTNITLAYLVDILEALNAVNLKLQGKSLNIIMDHDTIQAFMAKLDPWICWV
ncbi:protein FAM200C-like [Palaemon carinicauda]|uniref:protein FAM200C-like n=1 Tax=Palaemon carinicauda TaxID=392227 RepID=UPI0035B67EDA